MNSIYLAIIILFTLICPALKTQAATVFNNVEEALAFAEGNAISLNVSKEQYLLSKYDVLIAKINVFNPRGTVTASAIDNLQLPTNFLAGESSGESSGTAQEVQFGMRYASNMTINSQLDIINLGAWEKLKSAKLNEQLAEVNERVAQKSLLESVAASYFNIVSIQKQIKILQQNLANNDSILKIVINKYEQGLVRQQDANQAEVNKLLIQDKISQLEFNLQSQINGLKVLCDIKEEQSLNIYDRGSTSITSLELIGDNILLSSQNQLQKKIARADLKASKKKLYPSISLVGSYSWKDDSEEGFFDKNSSSSQSSYIGLQLNYDIPSASFFGQDQKAESNLKIAVMNEEHIRLQERMNNDQLILDYQKSIATLNNSDKVLALKSDTFDKNRNIYNRDLISTDTLLLSLNDKISSNLTHTVNEVNHQYYIIKIKINRDVQ